MPEPLASDPATVEAPQPPMPQRSPASETQRIANARVWRRIVGATFIVPGLGTLAALALAWRFGIGALELGLLAGMYVLVMTGSEVGFHRLLAHGAFQTKPWLRATLTALGSMSVQGPAIFWVANHRKHHAHSDQPGDPHSPHLHGAQTWRGLWHAHMGWALIYRDMTDWIGFVPDLFRDPIVVRIHRRYFLWAAIGLLMPSAVGGLAAGSWWGAGMGFLWGGLVRIFLVNQAAYSIGSICHSFGRRPFNNGDHSADNYWLAIPTFGASYQNSHHAFPAAAKLNLWWGQIDVGGLVIGGLQALGLAWHVKTAAERVIPSSSGTPPGQR